MFVCYPSSIFSCFLSPTQTHTYTHAEERRTISVVDRSGKTRVFVRLFCAADDDDHGYEPSAEELEAMQDFDE